MNDEEKRRRLEKTLSEDVFGIDVDRMNTEAGSAFSMLVDGVLEWHEKVRREERRQEDDYAYVEPNR